MLALTERDCSLGTLPDTAISCAGVPRSRVSGVGATCLLSDGAGTGASGRLPCSPPSMTNLPHPGGARRRRLGSAARRCGSPEVVFGGDPTEPPTTSIVDDSAEDTCDEVVSTSASLILILGDDSGWTRATMRRPIRHRGHRKTRRGDADPPGLLLRERPIPGSSAPASESSTRHS